MQVLKQQHIENTTIAFLMGFLITDFFTSVAFKTEITTFYRYSAVLKLLFEVFMLAVIVSKTKQLRFLHKFILTLVVVFTISQFLLGDSSYNFKKELLQGNIYFFNRYLYLLIFILYVKTIVLKKETYKKIYRCFEYFLHLNAIVLVLGYLFHIEIFRSYEFTSRFGVTGFFSKPDEASYMYIIPIIVNYYFWIVNKDKNNLFKVLFFVFCSLFLGQKKMFLFLVLLTALHLVTYSRFKKIFQILVPTIVILLLYFKESIIKTFLNHSMFWNVVYEKSGLVSTIFSYRDQLFLKAIQYVNKNWSFLNYFFGGLDFNEYKMEFELVDLYIFLGVFGVLYYLYILFSCLKGADALKRNLIILTFCVSFISGGLILNVAAAILFYIAAKYIMKPINLK